MNLGFLGLGQMGRPMAVNLLRAGYQVTVWNRSPARSDELAEQGARIAISPAEAADGAEVLISMLSDDTAVRSAVLGGEASDGAIDGLPQGSVHVCMSTISPQLSHLLAQAHDASGQSYVAAPVFGRPDVAERGALVVIAAGADDDIERCRPVLDAMSRRQVIVGDRPALANVVKLAGNFLIASMVESLGEAFTLIDSCGISGERFLDIVTGLFQSPMYQDYGRRIADRAFDPPGFRLGLGMKDIKLLLDAAETARVPMPVASLLRDRFLMAEARGLDGQDWAAVGRTDSGLGL